MAKTKLKVCFLDCDGVCNSLASCLVYKTYERFDSVAIGLLERAAVSLDLRFVLSSAWRVGRDIEGCRDIFRSRGHNVIYERLIDKTPSLLGIRGEEIYHWLKDRVKRFPNELIEYAIIDDDSDMLPEQMSRFIKTDHYQGFHFLQYVRLIELFEPDNREARNFRKIIEWGNGRVVHGREEIEDE